MPKRLIPTIAAALLIVGAAAPAVAQEAFADVLKIDDKSFSKMVTRHLGVGPFDDGHGTIAALKGKDGPKRIGVVSFYLFDRGTTGKSEKAGAFLYTSTTWINDNATNYLATTMAQMALPKIVESFSKYGMEVLTPDQFLIDDAKKSAYRAFQPEISSLSKKFLTKDDNFMSQGAARGFMTKPAWAPFDYKTAESFGTLAKQLGVDAVMVVVNEVSTDGDKIFFDKIGLHVYGPNPIAKVEGKRYPGMFGAGYQEGQLYEGEDWLPKKPFQFVQMKGKNQGDKLDGYELLAGRLAGNVASWIESQKQGKVK